MGNCITKQVVYSCCQLFSIYVITPILYVDIFKFYWKFFFLPHFSSKEVSSMRWKNMKVEVIEIKRQQHGMWVPTLSCGVLDRG